MSVGAEPVRAGFQVSVLGALQVVVDGRPVDVPGRRRRAVLAMLAMARGRVVAADGLVDAIWPDDPPETGRRAVHSHISRLRGNLGSTADRLRQVGAGYSLQIGPEELDASIARGLAEQVRVCLISDPTRALGLARTALALWRGLALAEFPEVPALVADAIGLTELQRRLRDDEVEAALAARNGGVTALAAEVAAIRPPRERSTMLLMRALASEGRTAEAMAVAATYRRELAEDTGLDPGPVLSALEQRIAAGEQVESMAMVRAEIEPSQATAVLRSTIVRPTTPMVGREQDRMRLLQLIRTQPAVTVTGPGGVGKTRLAFDVAAELAEHGRVAVIALAAVTEPNRVPEAVASTLGLQISGPVGTRSVADALAGQALLLVLDNCEHVLAACRELITEMLTRGVRVLATSRVSLHVPDEYLVRLQPLPLPAEATELPDLIGQPGVRAFLEHAHRRCHEFTLTDADAAPLVEVIRQLDGLPLAIELAAAQVAVLPLPALRERLGRALDALSTNRPSADVRHRTLRATIDWSYRLLDPADRHLLSAVAIFPGGVDLATMEDLATELVPGIDPLVVLNRLCDASLLLAGQQSMNRYTLLETVRRFLLDELDDRQRDLAEQRFLRWAADTAQHIGSCLHGPDEPVADQRLRAELANLRAARDLSRTRGDFDLRVDITLSLDEVSIWRGLHEVWGWSLELTDAPALHGHPRETEVIGSAAMAAWLLGDLDRAMDLANRGIRDSTIADTQTPADFLTGADPARRCWRALGAVSLFRSDFPAAYQQLLRAAAADPHPAPSVAAAALAALYAGDRTTADDLLARATELLRDQPWPSVIAFVTYIRGEALAHDNPAAADAAYTAARETAQRCGAGFVEGVALVGRASMWTAIGDTVAAATSYQCLLDYWQTTNNKTMLWTTVRNAAQLLIDQGKNRTAAMLLAAADNAHSAQTVDTPTAQGLLRMTRTLTSRIDPTTLKSLQREAVSLGVEKILKLARDELDELSDPAGLQSS